MAARRLAFQDFGETTRRLVEKYGAREPVGGRSSRFLTQQLLEAYGSHATDALYERSFYTRDVAPLPPAFDWVFRTLPDVVVRPRATEEAADIVALANGAGTAITVRAGASTSLGGCVPLRGGVVLDTSALKGVVGIDLDAKTVRVRAGTVWTELERTLAPYGLAPLAVPSSAPASSVGGWLSTGGYGIGSLKYGPFADHVRSIEVVRPDGAVSRLTQETDPPLTWFAGSEGTLGVITELELAVRDVTPMKHVLVACEDMARVQQVLRFVLSHQPIPYAIHFDDRHLLRALAGLGYAPRGWDGEHLLRLDWQERQAELEAADRIIVQLRTSTHRVRVLSDDVGVTEWRDRFRALRVKRGGPSVAGAEALLPLARLDAYTRDVDELAGQVGKQLMTYGHVASTGKIIVMTMYYTDETRTLDYVLDLGLVKKLHDISNVHGGSPYGLGLWNTPHVRPGSDPTTQELLWRKRALDEKGVMNPGKGVARLAVMNPGAVRTGMTSLSTLGRLFRKVQR